MSQLRTHGGHVSYLIESEGKTLLLLMGDLIRVPAVQFAHPNVTIAFDADPGEAASRIKVFNRVAKEGTLVAGAHLPFPGLRHLRAAGSAYRWVPADYSRRPAQKPKSNGTLPVCRRSIAGPADGSK